MSSAPGFSWTRSIGFIQTTFGWTDSHLHRFATGPSVWDRTSQLYLCPFDVEEGDDPDGIPEQDVRLDEVLVDVDERLRYVYDYGDAPDGRSA